MNKIIGIDLGTTNSCVAVMEGALSFACSKFDIACEVYMVKISYHQKPYRKNLMNTWGAKVFASPTDTTDAGRKILAGDPDSPGHWALPFRKR